MQWLAMVPVSPSRLVAIRKVSIGRALPRLLQLLTFVCLIEVMPTWAKEHPVPLEKNVDSAKCLECHNSDDNREFGGAGPNGPHGSINSHILERNYQFSQAAIPGGPVTNLFPNPDTSVAGPFSMCAKCHDLTQIFANTSFTQHNLHSVQYGFSCSVCHTAHGMGATSPTISGERLVNFDANVVGPNGAAPIAYNRSTNSCTLMCHSVGHNADGTVAASAAMKHKAIRGK